MAKKKKSNFEDYNKQVNEVGQRQLNIQTEIYTMMEKQKLTGEKLTRAEKKRAEDLQTELNVRIKTKNELGRQNILKKDELKMTNEELKTIEKIASGRASVTDLYQDYIKLQMESEKLSDGALKTSKEEQMFNIEREISWQRTNDIQKKYIADLKSTFPLLQKATDLVKNPAAGIGLIMAGVTKMALDWNEQLEVSFDTFGAMGPQLESALSSKIQKANKEMAGLDISFKEVAGYVGTIADKFGVSVTEAVDMAYNTADMAKSLGVSGEELIELENIYVNIVGLSRENADLTLKQQMSWLETAGVVPQAVMRDMGRSTEIIARYTSHMGTNLLNAATQANKLGVSLDTIDKMSNSVLNFQQSIRDEFELSVLLGKQMDLRTARAAFLNKDFTAGLEAVTQQLGGIDIKSLDALTVEKLASTFGMSYEELNKVINNQGKLENLEEATVKTLQGQNTERIKATEAQTKLTEAMNITKNVNRLINSELVENWDKVENIASTYTDTLKAGADIVDQIGSLTTGLITSTGLLAASAWGYANAMRAARGFMGGGGMFGGNFTGKNPKGTTSWNQFRSANKGKGWDSKTMSDQYKKAGGRNQFGGTKNLFSKQGVKNLSKSMRGKGALGSMLSMALMLGTGGIPQGAADIGGFLGGMGGAGIGAALGSFLGPLGTIGGSIAGGYIGDWLGQKAGGAMQDDFIMRPGQAAVPFNPRDIVMGIKEGTSVGGGGSSVEIDYDKLALAVHRGQMRAFKDHGVPNVTDQRIYRGTDAANSAWRPNTR